MWMGGGGLFLLALIPVVVMWLREEDVKTRELDARLDAEDEAAAEAEAAGWDPLSPG
jgi:hypothetical protein